MKKADSVKKGTSKVIEIKKDINLFLKNVAQSEQFDLQTYKDKHWKQILNEHFGKKQMNINDTFFYVDLMENMTTNLDLLKKYGLTQKNYYIEDIKGKYSVQKGKKCIPIENRMWILIPCNKTFSIFWGILQNELDMMEYKREYEDSIRDFYNLIAIGQNKLLMSNER